MSSFDGHTNMKWVPKRSNTFLVPSTTTTPTTTTSQRESSPKHFQSNANDRALKNNKTKSFSEWSNHQPHHNRSQSPGHLPPRDVAGQTSYYHYSVKTPTISITHKAIVPAHTQPQKPSPQRSQSSQSFAVTRARSKSDPFRDSVESITVDYPQTVSTSTSTEAFVTENPIIITPRKYNASKPHRNYKKKNSHPKMVNSASQTYVHISTQTSDDEEAEQEETVLQAARLLILNATQKKESKGKKFGSTRSISFNGPNTLQDNSNENSPTGRSPIGTPTFKSEQDLITEINDLEEEIAKMRFKALSLKEQMRWIQHEKELRPGAPVVDLEYSPSHSASSSPSVVMQSPTMIVSPLAERPVVIKPVASPLPNVVPTIEFTDSKPATDRCFSPVSVLKPAMLRAIDVKSPDPEKRQELSKMNSRASAFQPSNRPLHSPSSLQKNRMTKSLDSLPDLNARDAYESPLVNSSPVQLRKNSKTINISSLED